jgi:hypothetical protein
MDCTILVGECAPSGVSDVYALMVDANGGNIWDHTYGGTLHDAGYAVTPVHTGGYLIAGMTYSFGPGVYDGYLVRINEAGDMTCTPKVGQF